MIIFFLYFNFVKKNKNYDESWLEFVLVERNETFHLDAEYLHQRALLNVAYRELVAIPTHLESWKRRREKKHSPKQTIHARDKRTVN